MKIEIKKKNSQITVNIEVPGYYDHGVPEEKIKLNTNDVRNILISKNHQPGKCQKHSSINNKINTAATWVFENLAPTPKSPARKPATKSQKTKKHEKVLDISPKDVIIKNKPTK